MFLAALHLLPIKDLKALSFFLSVFFYRHAGPKGPEETEKPNQLLILLILQIVKILLISCEFCSRRLARRGTGPRPTVLGGVLFTVVRELVPRDVGWQEGILGPLGPICL